MTFTKKKPTLYTVNIKNHRVYVEFTHLYRCREYFIIIDGEGHHHDEEWGSFHTIQQCKDYIRRTLHV